MTITKPQTGQSAVCEPILRALPTWFGIEEATQQYIEDVEAYPTFLAIEAGQTRGFLTLVEHTPRAAEIHVMAVHPDYHRHGIGRRLLAAAEAHLRERGFKFLQVKTISDKHPDEGYKLTRKFYLAMDFEALEEFPDLWGPHNPCLQLIKVL